MGWCDPYGEIRLFGSGSPVEIRLLEEINAKAQRRKDAKVVDLP
jgi:hypothetical protein